jgi:hypothetical protein
MSELEKKAAALRNKLPQHTKQESETVLAPLDTPATLDEGDDDWPEPGHALRYPLNKYLGVQGRLLGMTLLGLLSYVQITHYPFYERPNTQKLIFVGS